MSPCLFLLSKARLVGTKGRDALLKVKNVMAMNAITIHNKGKDIVATDYFGSALDKAGKFYVSLNAGAFRLLVPAVHAKEIRLELFKAKSILIEQAGEVASIVFDDGSADPYTIQTTMNAFDRRPAATDSGKACEFTAWVAPLAGGDEPFSVAKRPCTYIRK